MIKAIIRKTYKPIQIILDRIRCKRYRRMMMNHTLKIHKQK